MTEGWTPGVIVVGVDGSERSIDAAQVAADLARTTGSRLHLVTVVRPPEGWWGVVGSPPPAESMGNALARAQQEVLDTVVAQLDLTGVEYEAIEEIGDPAGALFEHCRLVDAGLLVVGRRGAGILERIVMGSVADRLAHYSPCPVMIVP